MSMLSQAYAGTGDATFKQKLDYIVRGLAECQDALATAAKKPTPRDSGKFGGALRLSGSPIGLAGHRSPPPGGGRGLRRGGEKAPAARRRQFRRRAAPLRLAHGAGGARLAPRGGGARRAPPARW